MTGLPLHYYSYSMHQAETLNISFSVQQKYLHSCVLEKIFEFYENVLSSDQYIQNDGLELIYTLDRVRNCTYKVRTTNNTITLYWIINYWHVESLLSSPYGA